MEGFTRGVQNDMLALQQGSSPVLSDVSGKEHYVAIGEYTQDDSGRDLAITKDGQWVEFNPQQHVIFEDESGRNMVYLRNKSQEEGPIGAAGRALGIGAVTNGIEFAIDSATRLAKVLGTSVRDIPQSLVQLYEQAAAKLGHSDELARQVAAQEQGVSLLRGQATRQDPDMHLDKSAAAGAQGSVVAARVNPAVGDQAQRVSEIPLEMSERLGEGRNIPISGPDQGAHFIAQRVQDEERAMNREIQGAYERVPNDTALDVDSASLAPYHVANELRTASVDLDNPLTPATQRAWQVVKDLENPELLGGRELGKYIPDESGAIVGYTIQGLEHARRKIRAAVESAATPADRRGARLVLKAYDDFLTGMINEALFSGSEEAYAALRQARSLRAEYGRLFEGGKGDATGNFVDLITEGDKSAGEVANWIFGAANGAVAEGPALRNVERLVEIFGSESQEMLALRQLLWAKISLDPKTLEPLSAARMLQQLKVLVDGSGRNISSRIFTREQLATMRRLRGTLQNMTYPPRIGNAGQSGYEMSRNMQGLVSKMVGGLGLTGAVAGLATGTIDAATAFASMTATIATAAAINFGGKIKQARKANYIVNPKMRSSISDRRSRTISNFAKGQQLALPPIIQD